MSGMPVIGPHRSGKPWRSAMATISSASVLEFFFFELVNSRDYLLLYGTQRLLTQLDDCKTCFLSKHTENIYMCSMPFWTKIWSVKMLSFSKVGLGIGDMSHKSIVLIP